MATPGYRTFHYPASRIGTFDVGRFALRKHHGASLLEVDVTDVISTLRKRRGEGQTVSFFSWMVKAISTAIAEDPTMHALHGWGRSTVVFDDVDISVMVEKEVQGVRVPLPLLIKQTNEK